jgi:hypothetical protein
MCKCTRTKTGVEREWNETLTGMERKLMGRWRDLGRLVDGKGNVVGLCGLKVGMWTERDGTR